MDRTEPDINDDFPGDDLSDDLDAQPEDQDQGVILEGTTGQLSFAVGGKKPTSSMITLKGGRLDMSGQFSNGETVRAYVEFTIENIAFPLKTDSATGLAISCQRVHTARITGIERITDDPSQDA